jgi:predicted ester cyclase
MGNTPADTGVLVPFSNIYADSSENLVIQGDMVAARLVVTGTHRGDFAGIPPTGKAVSMQVFDLIRVVDGKATEHWGLSDQFGLLQQLGAIPAPGHG